MYTVEVEFPEGDLPGPHDQKITGKIFCSDETVAELSFSGTPLWFSVKGDNKRYEIKVYQDGSCEFSRRW